MKYFIILALLLTSTVASSQKMFQHEKEIRNKTMYAVINIDFKNSIDNIVLSGTLISPKKPFHKIVVIVPGSGKDTRFNHYKLTEEFLKNNIAVYRFDERGVGNSEGIYTTNITSLSNDILFSINHLQKLFTNKKIGLLGHSLGAMASVISTVNLKTNIDFLIQLAAPVKNFMSASKYQTTTFSINKNTSLKQTNQLLDTLMFILKNNIHLSSLKIKEKGVKAIRLKGFQLKNIRFWSLSHIELYKQDLEKIYTHLKIPTIYLIGSKDKFINAKTEINYLKKYNNPLVTFKVMKNLNHYLTKGALNTKLMYNIDTSATKTIMNWVAKI